MADQEFTRTIEGVVVVATLGPWPCTSLQFPHVDVRPGSEHVVVQPHEETGLLREFGAYQQRMWYVGPPGLVHRLIGFPSWSDDVENRVRYWCRWVRKAYRLDARQRPDEALAAVCTALGIPR